MWCGRPFRWRSGHGYPSEAVGLRDTRRCGHGVDAPVRPARKDRVHCRRGVSRFQHSHLPPVILRGASATQRIWAGGIRPRSSDLQNCGGRIRHFTMTSRSPIERASHRLGDACCGRSHARSRRRRARRRRRQARGRHRQACRRHSRADRWRDRARLGQSRACGRPPHARRRRRHARIRQSRARLGRREACTCKCQPCVPERRADGEPHRAASLSRTAAWEEHPAGGIQRRARRRTRAVRSTGHAMYSRSTRGVQEGRPRGPGRLPKARISRDLAFRS